MPGAGSPGLYRARIFLKRFRQAVAPLNSGVKTLVLAPQDRLADAAPMTALQRFSGFLRIVTTWTADSSSL
jgi:fumarate hydratase class II